MQSEEQKKQNTEMSIRYMAVVLGLIFAYILGGVGYALGMEGSRGLSTYIDRMTSLQFFYPLNGGAVGGIFLGLGLGVASYFGIKLSNTRHQHYADNEVAGTGGFATKKEIAEYTEKYTAPEDGDPDDPKVTYDNIILSEKWRRPVDLGKYKLRGNNNVLIVGGSGSGKSFNYIKPNILQMNASYVITDPSGEMVYDMGDALRKNGYNVKIFNISEMQHSNCYNPFAYIRDEAGVMMLIECFIKNTTRSDSGKGDQFFTDAEKLLYSACIFYLMEFETDSSKKNFPTIVNMINMSAVDENNADAKSPLDTMFEGLPASSLASKYYKSFKQAAGKTLKSIIISCMTRLQPFLVPQVVNLTQKDELHLEKLGEEKTALFIITPQADRTYAFLAAMLYSQMFETLYNIGEEKQAKTGKAALKIPVMALMDEFANIGEVPEFPAKLATMRKYNISASIVLQDISQIQAMYDKEWKSIVGNCSTILFLGSKEPETLKYFSEMLGKKTIKTQSRNISHGKGGSTSQGYQATGREVMTAEELGRMDENMCVVFTQSMRPVFDQKFKSLDHKRWKQTPAGGTPDDPHTFIYREMPAYDNSRIQTESILRAASSAQKIIEQTLAAKIRKPSSIVLGDTLEEAMNNFVLNPQDEQQAIEEVTEECIAEYSMWQGDGETDMFPIAEIKNTPTGRLTKVIPVLQNIQGNKFKTGAILTKFSEYPEMEYFVIYSDNPLLDVWVKNDYAQKVTQLADHIYSCTIPAAWYPQFKQCVMEAYKNS